MINLEAVGKPWHRHNRGPSERVWRSHSKGLEQSLGEHPNLSMLRKRHLLRPGKENDGEKLGRIILLSLNRKCVWENCLRPSNAAGKPKLGKTQNARDIY